MGIGGSFPVSDIWQILVQFLLRLTIGMAIAMALTSPKIVNAAFYRVHLWVLLGMNTFAAVVVYLGRDSYAGGVVDYRVLVAVVSATALLCYITSVVWLYENKKLGHPMLHVIAAFALVSAMLCYVGGAAGSVDKLTLALATLDVISSGLLLGFIVTAMLLGHWYLNNPSMDLLPMWRLLMIMGSAIVTRGVLCLITLGMDLSQIETPNTSWWMFLGLRWAAGIVGTMALAVLAWKTLKIPNTQSATGILYAAVILAFIGELTSALLSAQTPHAV